MLSVQILIIVAVGVASANRWKLMKQIYPATQQRQQSAEISIVIMRKYFQGLINFMEKRVLRYERLVCIGLASKRRNSYGTYVADASNRDIIYML